MICNPSWKALLWDWDGTLANTVPLIVAAHHAATEQILGLRIDEDLIRAKVGQPAQRRIRTLVGHAHAHDVFTLYSKHMARIGDEDTELFLGLDRLLKDAAADGFMNVIVTSRPRTHVVPVLRRLDLDRYVEGVVGLEDTKRHKPLPEPLLRGATVAAAAPNECVYIGDATVDLRAAANARMPSVAVTWGAGTISDLTEAGFDHIAGSCSELREVLGVRTTSKEDESA